MSEVRDVTPADIAQALDIAPTVMQATVVERHPSSNTGRGGRTEVEVEVDAGAVPVEVADTLYSKGWRIVTVQRSNNHLGTRLRAARREEVRGL